MVRNEWELVQHARHVRQEALDAANRRRLLALAEGGNGGRRGLVSAAAVTVAGWLERTAHRLRQAGGPCRIEPTQAGPSAARLHQGC